jgi:integrase/recombinase XerD
VTQTTSLATLSEVSIAALIDGSRSSAGEFLPIGTVRSADRHPALVYLARLASGSRRTMRQSLDVVAGLLTDGEADHETFPWEQLRYQHTAAIRAVLQEQYAPATANKILSAVRGVLEEAWQLQLMGSDDFHRARGVKAIKGTSLKKGRHVARQELRALFAACAADPGVGGRRDGAILATLYGAGLRRAEVVGLDLRDLTADGGLVVRGGKGNKSRIVPLEARAREALRAWTHVRGADAGPLFLPRLKSDRLVWRRLTEEAIIYIVLRRAGEAGISDLTPHDFRRTFATNLLEANIDLVTVRDLMGHSDINTTAGYDRRGEDARRSAVQVLRVPFVG